MNYIGYLIDSALIIYNWYYYPIVGGNYNFICFILTIIIGLHPSRLKMGRPDKKAKDKQLYQRGKKAIRKAVILCKYANLSKLTLPIRLSLMERLLKGDLAYGGLN